MHLKVSGMVQVIYEGSGGREILECLSDCCVMVDNCWKYSDRFARVCMTSV
jgi:hypothetical protein